MRRTWVKRAWVVSLAVAAWGAEPGCRRPRSDENPSDAGTAADHDPRLIFPPEKRAADESVNDFIERAMNTLLEGDYDAFRLLWVIDQEPFKQEQFLRGWQTLQEVRVEVLQPIRHEHDAQDDVFYGVCAFARLDPTRLPEGVETERRMVLEIVKEHGQWRLAHPSEDVRQAIMALYRDPQAFTAADQTDAQGPGASDP